MIAANWNLHITTEWRKIQVKYSFSFYTFDEIIFFSTWPLLSGLIGYNDTKFTWLNSGVSNSLNTILPFFFHE